MFIACAVLTTLLTACGVKDDIVATTPIPTATIAPTKAPRKDWKVHEKIPLETNNGVIGFVRVNQIEKLSFSDWSNHTASKHAINTSYSVNLTVGMLTSPTSSVSLQVIPFFSRDGDEISSLADLGWNGFNATAEFYDGGRKSFDIEVGVQQEENLQKTDKLCLKFKMSDGTQIKPVYLSNSTWLKAKKGPKVLTAKDEVKIKSITKAVYSITPKKVFFEDHQRDRDYQDGDTEKFFDIDYTVKAYKSPKGNRSIATITNVGKRSTLVCKAVIGLQAQESTKVLYQNYPKAGRVNYSDIDDLYTYATEGSVIKFGYKRKVTTNRLAEAGTNKGVQKVRLRLQFPEESDARTLKQKLNFNGRYLVYELKIGTRKLGVYYDD